MESDPHTDAQIRAILGMRRVAVVGMSRDPAKDAHRVPAYLAARGYDVTPVNPSAGSILGLRSYARVSDIGREIDTVCVFRPSGQVVPVVLDALKKRPRAVWLQAGIRDEAAEGLARAAGADVVYNRCMMAEHGRLAA